MIQLYRYGWKHVDIQISGVQVGALVLISACGLGVGMSEYGLIHPNSFCASRLFLNFLE